LVFDYNFAEMIVKAFEDYVKGPGFIKSNDPEVLHSNILELSKAIKSKQQNYLPPNQVEKTRAEFLKKCQFVNSEWSSASKFSNK